jgi:hypothetical protein
MSYDDSGPRLGQKSFTVLIAVLMASAAYLIMAARFGDPLRQARETAADARNLQATLPTAVERAVEKRIGDLTKAEELERSTLAAVAKLEAQLAGLQQSVARAESAAVQARRDAELARLAAATGTPIQGVTQQAFASPAPEYQAPVTVQTGTAPSAVVASKPADDAPTSLSARDGPFRIDLIRQSVTSEGVLIEFLLTKERGGDAAVELVGPSRNAGVRILTSDGIESNSGSAIAPNGNSSLARIGVSLAEGVPSRCSVLFRGKFDDAVLCRRVELAVGYTENRNRAVAKFRFDDVVATRY